MLKWAELIQESDWKREKHVPVIESPTLVKKDEPFAVKVTVGKEIAHPNTTEHHIRWITLFFHPEGEKFPYQLGHYEFNSHGESTQGPNTGPAYTLPTVTASFQIKKRGTIYALAFCNIHGLWQSAQEITVQD